MSVWDEKDIENDLRESLARIVGSMISGIAPDDLRPSTIDYQFADELRARVENYAMEVGL